MRVVTVSASLHSTSSDTSQNPNTQIKKNTIYLNCYDKTQQTNFLGKPLFKMLAIILVSDFFFFYTNQLQHLSQMIKRVCIQATEDLVPSGILTVSICECSMVFCFSRSAQRVSSCRHSSRMTRSCSCHEVCEKQPPFTLYHFDNIFSQICLFVRFKNNNFCGL